MEKRTAADRGADPDDAGVLDELIEREAVLHWPELGASRADLERMLAEKFWEVGASGRRYSRDAVLDELERRSAMPHKDVCEMSDFACERVAGEVYLLTYTLLQHGTRLTRRTTIWERHGGGWRSRYHQGTVVEGG